MPVPLGRSLRYPVVLASTAGFVDAVAFLHLVGAFPANQSGNLVLLGMATSSPAVPPAWVSVAAVLGFTAGVGTGAWFAGRADEPVRPRRLLVAELVLLVVLAAVVAGTGTTPEGAVGAAGLLSFEGPARAAVLLLAAVAMGLQTEAIRRASGIGIATTYESGAVARIGEVLGALAEPAPDDSAANDARRSAARTTVAVLGVVVGAYIVGAALGASRLGEGRTALALPCVLVAGVIASVWRGHVPE